MSTGGGKKVAVVGAGAVGATLAYATLIRGVAGTVALYDLAGAKVKAEVLDLRHGLQFVPHADVIGSDDIAVCENADVIAITAGAKQKPGQTRLDLAGVNVRMTQSLVPQLLEVAPNAVLVLVSNPVDVLTLAATKVADIPKNRVLGTGTVLDSSRLRDMIASRVGVAVQSVHAWIAGEHGDHQFPLWSSASVGAVPLGEFSIGGRRPMTKESEGHIANEVMTAAYQIIEGKGATNYAIGLAATRVIEAIVRNEHSVLPVTSLLNGVKGLDDVCLSLPSVVGSDGIEAVLDTPMSDEELQLLQEAAVEVRKVGEASGV